MEYSRQNTPRDTRQTKVINRLEKRGRKTKGTAYTGNPVNVGAVKKFVRIVEDFHRHNGRHTLPWRIDVTPYKVLVSELMLQQTQVERVIPKFISFMERFPTIESLARAPQRDVLILWQGLGYNRRARFLHLASQALVRRGSFPNSKSELTELPGIGPYTAGAIRAFAYNQPELFLETNIRAVLIHHFFSSRSDVTDADLLQVLRVCMNYVASPARWYAALMDYGTHIKRTIGNVTRRSATYVRQSPFRDSKREIRGSLIRALTQSDLNHLKLMRMHERFGVERVESLLADLIRDELIVKRGRVYTLR